jgi:dolichyl-phosphate beta-glucosyltransferase
MRNNLLVVVPFYNEAERINDDFILSLLSTSEIDFLFVDDGSKDNTLGLLSARYEGFSNLRINSLPSNVGKSEAIRVSWKTALNNFNYAHLGFLDSDGALTLEDLLDCLNIPEKSPRVDAIWKSRVRLSGRKIERSLLRHYTSRFIATFFGVADPALPYDTQCGLKLFRVSEAFKFAIDSPFKTRWFIDLEIYSRLRCQLGDNLVIWEQPCVSWVEIENSHLSIRNFFLLVKEILFILRQLVKTRS